MRLDEFLFERGFFGSRTKAKYAVSQGRIFLNDKKADKPSLSVDETKPIKIEIAEKEEFVSLGGNKLSKALREFNFDVNGLICADIGASTGGFTDCLIKNGAMKVFAVDVNSSQLHSSLKTNERVIAIEKNVKDLTRGDFNLPIDLIVADLSFISATSVVKIFYDIIDFGKSVILLIKPQFEVGYRKKFKNGIIREAEIRKETCRRVYESVISTGLKPVTATTAPIREDKNVEYLLLIKKENSPVLSFEEVFNKLLF